MRSDLLRILGFKFWYVAMDIATILVKRFIILCLVFTSPMFWHFSDLKIKYYLVKRRDYTNNQKDESVNEEIKKELLGDTTLPICPNQLKDNSIGSESIKCASGSDSEADYMFTLPQLNYKNRRDVVNKSLIRLIRKYFKHEFRTKFKILNSTRQSKNLVMFEHYLKEFISNFSRENDSINSKYGRLTEDETLVGLMIDEDLTMGLISGRISNLCKSRITALIK
jgi:hypothetical protein